MHHLLHMHLDTDVWTGIKALVHMARHINTDVWTRITR